MNAIDYEARVPVYHEAIAQYGEAAQTMMVIEEMSELTKAICKLKRNVCAATLDEVIDECADVTIMLEQLRIILGINDKVCSRMDYKIKRLADRLGMVIYTDFKYGIDYDKVPGITVRKEGE